MVFKSVLLLSFAVVQLVMSATTSVTIVNPKPKQVWHAGQVVEFKWTSKATEPVANSTTTEQKHQDSTVSIALATGPSQSLVIDRVIASNINITKGSYKWKIPKDINTTKKYVIEIGPNASDIAFAGYVSIIKAPTKNGTTHSGKPTKTTKPSHSKPTQTVITTSKPTNKHEPTSVCVIVPNKNGKGTTVKCHPQQSHKKSKKKATLKKSSPPTATHPPIMVATPSI